jgi:hypothetical protein
MKALTASQGPSVGHAVFEARGKVPSVAEAARYAGGRDAIEALIEICTRRCQAINASGVSRAVATFELAHDYTSDSLTLVERVAVVEAVLALLDGFEAVALGDQARNVGTVGPTPGRYGCPECECTNNIVAIETIQTAVRFDETGAPSGPRYGEGTDAFRYYRCNDCDGHFDWPVQLSLEQGDNE